MATSSPGPSHRHRTDDATQPHRSRRVSRRALVTGGVAATALVAAAGAYVVHEGGPEQAARHLLHRPPSGPAVPMPTGPVGPRLAGSFVGRHMNGAATGWILSYPPRSRPGDRLPVVLTMHGNGDDEHAAFDQIGMDVLQGQVRAAGGAPFVLAAPSGGTAFWHPHRDGLDPAAMITDEFLPMLARDHGLDTGRLMLAGWSMGGLGAFTLAAKQLRGAVLAIAPTSVPVWTQLSECDPTAFDDQAQVDEYDLQTLAAGQAWGTLPIRLTCGLQDDFAPGDQDLVHRLSPTPQSEFVDGVHDPNYWRGAFPGQLRFLAGHL